MTVWCAYCGKQIPRAHAVHTCRCVVCQQPTRHAMNFDAPSCVPPCASPVLASDLDTGLMQREEVRG
jgi:hypothetical protein